MTMDESERTENDGAGERGPEPAARFLRNRF